MADCVGNPRELGVDSIGRPLNGLPGVKTLFSPRRLTYLPSKNGVSRPGVFGVEVGAVENPHLDDWEEYELSNGRGELADAKLTVDCACLLL